MINGVNCECDVANQTTQLISNSAKPQAAYCTQ